MKVTSLVTWLNVIDQYYNIFFKYISLDAYRLFSDTRKAKELEFPPTIQYALQGIYLIKITVKKILIIEKYYNFKKLFLL